MSDGDNIYGIYDDSSDDIFRGGDDFSGISDDSAPDDSSEVRQSALEHSGNDGMNDIYGIKYDDDGDDGSGSDSLFNTGDDFSVFDDIAGEIAESDWLGTDGGSQNGSEERFASMESENLVPFTGKFFTGFLGITPLVLYKEDPDQLLTQIKTYSNITLLNKLVLNMEGSQGFNKDITLVEGFLSHMIDAFNYHVQNQAWTPEEIDLATEIRSKVSSTWARIKEYVGLINLCRASDIEVSPSIDAIIRRSTSGSNLTMDSFNIVKILTAQEDPRKTGDSIGKKLITAMATESNVAFINSIISSYRLIIDQKNTSSQGRTGTSNNDIAAVTFESMQKQSNDSDKGESLDANSGQLGLLKQEFGSVYQSLLYLDNKSSISGIHKADKEARDYFSTDYSYSSLEYKVLEDLGFPVVIAGNEHQLKRRLTNPMHAGREIQAAFNNLTYIGMIVTKGELLARQRSFEMPETLIMF